MKFLDKLNAWREARYRMCVNSSHPTEFHQKIILRNKNIGKTKKTFGTNYIAAIKMKAIFTYDFYRTLIELFFAPMPCNRVIDHFLSISGSNVFFSKCGTIFRVIIHSTHKLNKIALTKRNIINRFSTWCPITIREQIISYSITIRDQKLVYRSIRSTKPQV